MEGWSNDSKVELIDAKPEEVEVQEGSETFVHNVFPFLVFHFESGFPKKKFGMCMSDQS